MSASRGRYERGFFWIMHFNNTTDCECANSIDTGREEDLLDQKLQRLFLYYACTSVRSSITLHAFCRNISLETSLYHTIEPSSSISSGSLRSMHLFDLGGQASNALNFTVPEVHVKVFGEGFDPVFLGVEDLQNFRLALDSLLDLFAQDDVLPDDLLPRRIQNHAHTHKRLSKPAGGLLTD